jgi:hypothetical protein
MASTLSLRAARRSPNKQLDHHFVALSVAQSSTRSSKSRLSWEAVTRAVRYEPQADGFHFQWGPQT